MSKLTAYQQEQCEVQANYGKNLWLHPHPRETETHRKATRIQSLSLSPSEHGCPAKQQRHLKLCSQVARREKGCREISAPIYIGGWSVGEREHAVLQITATCEEAQYITFHLSHNIFILQPNRVRAINFELFSDRGAHMGAVSHNRKCLRKCSSLRTTRSTTPSHLILHRGGKTEHRIVRHGFPDWAVALHFRVFPPPASRDFEYVSGMERQFQQGILSKSSHITVNIAMKKMDSY